MHFKNKFLLFDKKRLKKYILLLFNTESGDRFLRLDLSYPQLELWTLKTLTRFISIDILIHDI